MFGFFSKKDKVVQKEAEYLSEIEEMNITIANLKKELDTKNNLLLEKEKNLEELKSLREEEEKNHRILQKQMDIVEKNLRSMRENNNTLKKDKNILHDSALDGVLPIEKHRYKIPLSMYYSSSKFESILSILNEKGITYVNELNDEIISQVDINTKKIDEFKERYNDFLEGNIDIPTKIFALKGEKIKKIYSKNRKFVSYIAGSQYEYMNDIMDFSFEHLGEFGFNGEQIADLVEKQKIYYENNLIKGREV